VTSCLRGEASAGKSGRRPSQVIDHGNPPHPAATSAELAALLPGVEVLTDWRGPEYLDQQRERVVAFLKRYTPAS
jgi:hypothetical protein